jgi:hypothetical protein
MSHLSQKAKGHLHRRAVRGHSLSKTQKAANTTRSKVRARVEHVFGHQENSMGRKIVRTIGIARARFKIGMMNLGYNSAVWFRSSGRRRSLLEREAGVESAPRRANRPHRAMRGIKKSSKRVSPGTTARAHTQLKSKTAIVRGAPKRTVIR